MTKLDEIKQTIDQLPENQCRIAGALIAALDLNSLSWFIAGCKAGAFEGAEKEIDKLMELLR